MLNVQEKREHPRLDVGLEVYGPNRRLLGITKNISLSGCFIETKEHANNAFNISFLLPQSNRVVNALCEVKWNNNSAIGTAFTLNADNKNVFSEWLSLMELEFEIELCR